VRKPFVVLLLSLVVAAGLSHADISLEPAVVELAVTFQAYAPRQPWSKETPGVRSASAVVVGGGLLLTSAQMVADATLVRAGKHGIPPRVPAAVVHIDFDVNLALLSVGDPTFGEDLEQVSLAEQVPREGTVQSARWSNGRLEVSNSRVGRLEVRSGPTSEMAHAFLRVKSDLGGGGWAEPVFAQGRLVGVTASQDEEFANVIPVELIRAYLAQHGEGIRYRGFPQLGFSWQAASSAALAGYLGLEGPPRGVVVLRVPWGTTGCGILQPRDLLLSVAGRDIDAEGYFEHPVYGRLLLPHLISAGYAAGDRVSARLIRGGKTRDIELTLRRYPEDLRLVPGRRSDRPPPYVVAGGLVFRELDGDYLAAWGSEWRDRADPRLVTYWELWRDAQSQVRRRVILLTNVLPDTYNLGYHGLANLVVESVNGVPATSLSSLEEGFRAPADGVHRILFEPNPTRREVVLDAAGYEAATSRILSRYGVPEGTRREGSPQLAEEPVCDPAP
jgi:hypothetical protein